ncbi:apolipoprotein N-acyltransferase [Streptomyces sp. NPDC048248]|uniref:apolipoprotein N-acyltransferase n=1 Tax=Streptomyces sp. NPDC048248 TaxID=3365523 RepID=UPI00371C1873
MLGLRERKKDERRARGVAPEGGGAAAGVPRGRPPGRWLWVAGTVLLVLALHSNWHVALAAWLFPVFLLRYGRLRPARHGLLRIGWASASATLLWLVSTGMVFVPTVVGLFAVLAVLQTLPFVADRLIGVRSRSVLTTLVFPTVLVGGEYLFAELADFGDFGVLGFTQHGFLPLVQLASVTGVHGVSFVVAWTASMAHWLWQGGVSRPRVRRGVLVWAGVLAVVLGAGGVRLLLFAPVTDTVRVAGVSAGRAAERDTRRALDRIDPEGWRPRSAVGAAPERVRKALAPVADDLVAATDREARAGARIVVWPETQAGVLESDQRRLLGRVAAIAREHRVYVNAAYGLYLRHAPYVRNVAVLVTPEGKVAWTYDKAHPTPMETMKPGSGDVPVADSPHGRLATVICYDADYPDLMRQAADKGADMMLVPANDWVGFESLHAQRAVFRSVEYGYAMVRQSVNGVATAVDPQGRVLGTADYFTAGRQTLVAEVPVQRRTQTLYGEIGAVFGMLCAGGSVVVVGFGLLWRRERRSAESVPESATP